MKIVIGCDNAAVELKNTLADFLRSKGVEVEDEVGNLNRLLKALTESNINIDYTYLSFNRDSGKPVLIFHCEDAPEVEICIKNKGFSVV